MLHHFVYQPRQYSSGDDGGGDDWQPIGPFFFIAIATVIVVFIGIIATAFGAELPVPRKGTGYPDPRCNTAARYEAMREAYQLRLPDPCSGAKTWVR